MKVEKPREQKSRSVSKNTGQSVSGGRGRSGAQRLVEVPKETFDESLQSLEISALLEEVEAVGKQLFRYPSPQLLARYRRLVGDLLFRAEQGLQMKKDFRWRRANRATYVIIEKTENMLDQIEKVLAQEGERSKLLELMNEVKGCLISLFM
jgi:uncharacterized protein YaaR (DUF327 family)